MPANLTLSVGTLYAFLLVLARVGGALTFVPLPGMNAVPEPVRAALAVGFTLSLYARWPVVNASGVTIATLAGWAVAEAALGIAIGVCVAIVLETFTMAAQVLGLQAGYGYASTIDPNSQADSGILLVFSQLMAGMLFFALGLDREILRLFARSLDKVPVGTYILGPASADALIRLGSSAVLDRRSPGPAGGSASGDGGCGAGVDGPAELAIAIAVAGLPGEDADGSAGTELGGGAVSPNHDGTCRPCLDDGIPGFGDMTLGI